MSDVNRDIARWRMALSQEGRFLPDELDELESHLRESLDSLVRRGLPEDQALTKAITTTGDPLTIDNEFSKVRSVSAKTLWRAYGVAPLVAPAAFAAIVFVTGLLFTDPKDPGTPIGVILIPILSLTLGVAVSYLLAIACWMPVMFFLRKRGWLDAFRVHAAALLLSIVECLLIEGAFYGKSTPRPADLRKCLWPSTLVLAGMVIPSVMLSASTFWWLLARGERRVHA